MVYPLDVLALRLATPSRSLSRMNRLSAGLDVLPILRRMALWQSVISSGLGGAFAVSWQGTLITLARWRSAGFTFKMMILMLFVLMMLVEFSVALRFATTIVDPYVSLGVLLAHFVWALKLRRTYAHGKPFLILGSGEAFNGIQVPSEHHWTTCSCLSFLFTPYVSSRSSLLLFLCDINNRLLLSLLK